MLISVKKMKKWNNQSKYPPNSIFMSNSRVINFINAKSIVQLFLKSRRSVDLLLSYIGKLGETHLIRGTTPVSR